MTLTDVRRELLAAPHVTVLVDRCAGCEECLVRCPTGALALDADPWVIIADDKACVGCRQCERTCPFAAIEVEGPALSGLRVELAPEHPVHLLSDRTETRRGIVDATDALAEAERCLACPDPTCVRGCPAHNDIPGFIAALREGDLGRAHTVLRRTSVLPDVCSRVCDQAVQCEGACSWSLAGFEPVAIGALERFVADHAPVPPPAAPTGPPLDLDVAVVGSGPAGLAAAWELVEAGARVTVHEKDQVAGGLLGWGIPEFTLPASIVRRPVAALAEAGVEFRFNSAVTPEGLEELLATHHAVVLAVGAGEPLRLPVDGADLDGVWDATRFLVEGGEALAGGGSLPALDARSADREPLVLVVGAGNTAMDVARTARRLGARAVCVDWMDRRFAPVRPDELVEAEEEGVDIRFSITVDHLEGRGGRVDTAVLSRTRQRSAEVSPVVEEECATRLEVDLVVMAMGYRLDRALSACSPGVPVKKEAPSLPDRAWLASGLMANPAPRFARNQPVGTLALGRETARRAAGTPRAHRLWTVGDALTGPATVVEAMAQGREAARRIVALGILRG